jgi:signal transduction histidine kinase
MTGPDLQNTTILAVDDDPANLAVITDYLKECGFRVVVARDGESALEKARYGAPDLILLDLLMPKIDGYETCRRLKADATVREIPVIFMTALAGTEDKVRGFQAGAVDYITKPFQCEEVLARVRTHLSLRAMQRQIEDKNAELEHEIAERARAQEALRVANSELEVRVAQRTAELMRAVESLRAEIEVRTRTEAERAQLESRLLQAQKMESIGLLAGGIAHDFNNMLTPILGYAELLLADLPVSDPRGEDLRLIKRAAERAQELIRQLLALSRKQVLELKTVDLNDVVRRFQEMLRRVIREDIKIETVIGSLSATVRADVGQLEQVLMNLAVNAQDAMPSGGVLTIETEDVVFDEGYTRTHPDVVRGPYVMLAVSDTGVGMDSETQRHIFDPFFTTKERGKGTGLGLSIVYGIVKQHGGAVSLYSEPDKGTTLKIYLPRVEQPAIVEPSSTQAVPRGGETVLVVDDDSLVRELACKMLRRLGYEVLTAESAGACVRLVESCREKIDLLLTDVVMPEMNGQALYERLRERRPQLRVLYMSGYTSNVIVHHGVVDPHVHFVQKPLSLQVLAGRVRAVLDE